MLKKITLDKLPHHNAAMLTLFLFGIFMLLIICGSRVEAQTFVTDAYIKTQNSGNNHVTCSYMIVLNDTANIDEVELILGTVKQGDDLISCVFNVQQQSGLPNGMNYVRSGNRLTFSGSAFHEQSLYFGRVKLKSNGIWADPFDFISN